MGKKKGGKKEAKKEAGPAGDVPDRETEFEMLMTSKNLELAEMKVRAEKLADAIKDLRGTNGNLGETLVGVKKDSADILAHLERDMLEKRGTVAQLTSTVEELSVDLDNTRNRIAELESEQKARGAEFAAANRSIEEKHQLETMVQELRHTISNQNKTIQSNDMQISSLEQQLKSINRTHDDLKLKLSRFSTDHQVADHRWTFKQASQRLKSPNEEDETNIPLVRCRNLLVMVGRSVILFGGTTKEGKLCSNDTFVLNTETNEWERYAGTGDVPCPRGGMAVVMNNKRRLVVFGGRCGRGNPLLNDVFLLNPDNMKWVQLKLVGSDLPDPVEKATLCMSGDNVLLLGGDTTVSHSLTGLTASIPHHGWQLRMEGSGNNECSWTKVNFTGPVPQRCNASMTESPDGRYIYVFGGSDVKGEGTNDIFILNVDRSEWSIPEMVLGMKPPGREGHTAAMVGRFLIVSGGWNEHGRLFDTHVLDTESMVWEALGATQSGGGALDVDRARVNVFSDCGRRIFVLGSTLGQMIDELVLVDIHIPEEAFQQNVFVRKEMIQVEAMQDEADMREIKLAWRPPANSKARVSVYKVMMSLAGSSMVKEMYRGTDDSCRITGAKASRSYQFRVKGEYSDGSYIWSDICEIYMRQAGTEVVIPKQIISLRGRATRPATQIRGAPILVKPPAPLSGGPVPQRLGLPGTVGYAASMTKAPEQDYR